MVTELLSRILPVYLLFLTGLILRWTKILKPSDGELLLKIVFFFTLPALILKTLPELSFNPTLIWLPIASLVIVLLSGFFAWLSISRLRLPPEKAGVILISAMIMNIGFTIPFVDVLTNEKGLAYLFLFDFSNGILTYSLTYAIACRYGENGQHPKIIFKKLLLSPPIWALILALLLIFLDIKLPEFCLVFLSFSGQMTIPLFLIALALYFMPSVAEIKNIITGVGIRMLGGFIFGLALAMILPVDQLSKLIIVVGASAPVGFNTLTFAALEKLDMKLAASMVSFSVISGMISVPLILWLFQY